MLCHKQMRAWGQKSRLVETQQERNGFWAEPGWGLSTSLQCSYRRRLDVRLRKEAQDRSGDVD